MLYCAKCRGASRHASQTLPFLSLFLMILVKGAELGKPSVLATEAVLAFGTVLRAHGSELEFM